MKIKVKKWLIFVSFLIVALYGNSFVYGADCGEGFIEEAGVCVPTTTGLPNNNDANPVTTVVVTVMQWLLGIFGVIAIIAFVIAGIIYLTSAGDDERIQQAKRAMTYSIIGVVVALAGLVIVLAVDHMLRGQTGF